MVIQDWWWKCMRGRGCPENLITFWISWTQTISDCCYVPISQTNQYFLSLRLNLHIQVSRLYLPKEQGVLRVLKIHSADSTALNFRFDQVASRWWEQSAATVACCGACIWISVRQRDDWLCKPLFICDNMRSGYFCINGPSHRQTLLMLTATPSQMLRIQQAHRYINKWQTEGDLMCRCAWACVWERESHSEVIVQNTIINTRLKTQQSSRHLHVYVEWFPMHFITQL